MLFPQALPPVEGSVEEEVVAGRPTTTPFFAAVEAAAGAEDLQPLGWGPSFHLFWLISRWEQTDHFGFLLVNKVRADARCTGTLEDVV